MVNYSSPALDAAFGALSDPTRRAILARLARGEATVSQLAEPFHVSLPAISKHLRVLESAGLLTRAIDGRVHHCRLAPAPMKNVADWISQYRVFWDSQLDALAEFLETSATPDKEQQPCQPQDILKPRKNHKSSKSAATSPRRAKKSSPRGSSASN
jgi:DNA-binding transcriptional ArsR family regulator